MKTCKKIIALVLAFILVFSLNFTTPVNASGVRITKIVVKNSLTDSTKTVTVAKGKKIKLKTSVTANPNTKANTKVTFKSANPKIASVNKDGVIKGLKPGKTKIIVTSVKNPKKKATIKVTVKPSAVYLVSIIMPESNIIYTGSTLKLKANVSAKNNAYKAVKWSSSDKNIATVSKNGVVKAKKAGSVTISVCTLDGSNKQHEIELIIKNKPSNNNNTTEQTTENTTEDQNKKTGIEGKWVKTKIIEKDGKVLQGNDIGEYEEYIINGDRAYYSTSFKLTKNPIKIEYALIKNDDNTYEFKLVVKGEVKKNSIFSNVKFEGDTMTIITSDGETYIYTRQ